MKWHPIIFSGQMVRAIMERQKTQTRRVVTPQPVQSLPRSEQWPGFDGACDTLDVHYPRGWRWKNRGRHTFAVDAEFPEALAHASKYRVGDMLWVRETWGAPYADHPCAVGGEKPKPGTKIVYRANPADDWQWSRQIGFPWRPSIYMPRWASRLSLELTGVRVERLQDVTEDDAIAEGIEAYDEDGVTYYGPLNRGHCEPIVAFRGLWDSINAKRGYGWGTNPWVWVVEFRLVKGGV